MEVIRAGVEGALGCPGIMIDSVFAPKCVAIDLEIASKSGRLHHFAAIRGDKPDKPLVYSGGDLGTALRDLDDFADGAKFVLGHNVIAFDLPHLKAVAPDLRLLRLPAIDTLRLSPLAFPRNPYHRLIKHYKDGRLLRFSRNDPELDSRITLELLADEEKAFTTLCDTNPMLLRAWHWLTSKNREDAGHVQLFDAVSGLPRPDDAEGLAAIQEFAHPISCATALKNMTGTASFDRWSAAYALAWLSVAGGNSVLPPWVRHEFPATAELIRQLRDTRCEDTDCAWCNTHHNPTAVLQRCFGFPAFRPEPVCEDGRPMQEAIVAAAMGGEHVLGILPTGTGKSVCYQVPALARYENTGALTIVISPLVALMADQVHGLEARGITSCAALNGLLSMPERSDVLDRTRLGDIAILLVSPEQLRNRAFQKVIEQREIGAWVLDEAHCLSKWGQDFRTDYRYIGRFIKKMAAHGHVPPVLCLTATAKPDVVADICGYFLGTLGVKLRVFNGGTRRENLDFVVVETTPAHKPADIHALLESHLSPEQPGGAIVYCTTRSQTEQVAQFLTDMGWAAAHFHAGLKPEQKKTTQQEFISGKLRVIAATNAFGMGIDKPDVRLVIHAEIPGSLENYVQEAGRAGRDREAAQCVLLYCEQDLEQQFSLSAYARLAPHEIKAVLRALRRLAGKRRPSDEDVEVFATPGEILAEDEDAEFMRDSATDDTRVRTAVSWLEEARLVKREENHYQVFPSTLRIPSLEDADKKLSKFPMPYRGQLRAMVDLLMNTDPAEAVTTDELMGVSGLSSLEVKKALYDLEHCGIISNDSAFTALVHVGVPHSSKERMKSMAAMEKEVIAVLREWAPDLEKDSSSVLNLRRITQHLKDADYKQALPEHVMSLLRGLAADGRADGQNKGSLRLGKIDVESIRITLQRDWEALQRTAELRNSAANLLLAHLISRVPRGVRGNDLLAKTTLGNLHAAVEKDLALRTQVKNVPKLVECSMLWLHDQEIIRLARGGAIFRPAMRIDVAPGNAPFTRTDYAGLKDHYDEQVVQIHVMAEYARRGLEAAREALRLVGDYFTLSRDDFIARWFPKTGKNMSRQTGDASWRAIVDSLSPVQRRIVTDERERTNVLVLAGPGSGKTRVLVHRIAFLVRVRRENPRGILALAYNRHAAVEIRRRLRDLIGNDAKGVTVLTCHALAMRITGTSFADRMGTDKAFQQVLAEAIQLLKGEGLPADDADAQRDRLLAGFRWILVDEYQDIGLEQYELVSALAGRTLQDPDRRLSLFAVGDDDQNVYGFAGASVEYIRRFNADYDAKCEYLTANYRSTAHIIEASNALIARARDRMKTGHPIEIDEARRSDSGGGAWETLDPVARGRVQILSVGPTHIQQAEQVMGELLRLAALDPAWDWSKTAVIARQWQLLDPVVAFCEQKGIPAQRADREPPRFWRLRETQALVAWLSDHGAEAVSREEMEAWLDAQPAGPWLKVLAEAMEHYRLECGELPLPALHFREWLAEWGREIRRRQQGLLLLTAHRVKGLEFDHVAVLDGHWQERDAGEDPDAARRLFYVAMTRARKTLTLARMSGGHELLDDLADLPSVLRRDAPSASDAARKLDRRYNVLSLGDVYLDFAGQWIPRNPIHQAIANLQPGDALQLAQRDGRWFIDRNGQSLGRLASSYTPPAGMRCIEARVHAILIRFRRDVQPAYANSVRCDRWEVVIPELVFAPGKASGA